MLSQASSHEEVLRLQGAVRLLEAINGGGFEAAALDLYEGPLELAAPVGSDYMASDGITATQLDT